MDCKYCIESIIWSRFNLKIKLKIPYMKQTNSLYCFYYTWHNTQHTHKNTHTRVHELKYDVLVEILIKNKFKLLVAKGM